jgi:aminoglycoside phosphotransferase family enzyme/predicted kinase
MPVTRAADGRFVLGGGGQPVEWLVHMKQFDDSLLLDNIATRGGLDAPVCTALADTVFAFHQSADAIAPADPVADLRKVSEVCIGEMKTVGQDILAPATIGRLAERWDAMLAAQAPLVGTRAAQRRIRDGHGDLHLRNVVLIDGAPVLFDAIEFDPAIRHVDVLYDLAFLLMDLLHRDLKTAANQVLNRYLDRSGDAGGLALLPLYLSQRAGIRAHTTARAAADDPSLADEANAYLSLALGMTQPAAPRLVAVGGLSGSGKSTVGRALAPTIGPAPGAIHLRSDAIRKRLAGIAPETPLPPAAYTQGSSARVYAALASDTREALEAGYSVIADAVFGKPEESRAIEAIAGEVACPFDGIWLSAPLPELKRRVAARMGDASDAGVDVVEQQAQKLKAPAGWTTVASERSPAGSLAAVRKALAAAPSAT